jgi:diguanylate cyclase (GGDEF)-like protein
VNDTYGHEAGDLVLKRFADVLRANTRTSNICGRIGGEEFVLVITHVAKPSIQIAIDRIRCELEAQQFSSGDRIFGITASFGISGFQQGAVPNFSQVLREADVALYAAKRGGRNRIEFAEAFSAERQ